MGKKKNADPIATDPKVAELDEQLAKLAKKIDKADSKKKRKALQAEFDALDAKRTKRLSKLVAEDSPAEGFAEAPAGTDEERKAYVDAVKVLRLNGHPGQPGPDDIDRGNDELVKAYNLVIGKLTGHYLTSDAEKAAADAKLQESDSDIKDRVAQKRKEREAAAVAPDVEHDAKPKKGKKAAEPEAEVVPIEEAKSKKAKKAEGELAESLDEVKESPAAPDDGSLADPEPAQPRDRWDRPLITPIDGGKATGYRRVTTFIDVLDDKTALTNWGRRIVVAGVAAIEQKIEGEDNLEGLEEVGTVSVIERVKEANRDLAKTAQKADKALAKGKIDVDDHAVIHDEAEKAHKDALDALVQEAFRAGDGFTKAETGTRIHKLTEIWDTEGTKGLEALGDVTKSEYRDLEAYAAACAELNVEVQAVEQFVVVDELKIGGTLDRRIRYDSPKLGRRITAIGDVKTGRVDYGGGKMTRQLAAYAKGKGYDWRTNERTTFRTNQEVGLIFHLPAGSGTCTVYEIDLKKGAEGLRLCAQVYAHRDETKTPKVFEKVAEAKA